jgi:hypothetical protein
VRFVVKKRPRPSAIPPVSDHARQVRFMVKKVHLGIKKVRFVTKKVRISEQEGACSGSRTIFI